MFGAFFHGVHAMKLRDLIINLQECLAQVGDVDVLLDVTADVDGGSDEAQYLGNLVGAAAEQDHSTERMFVRVTGAQDHV